MSSQVCAVHALGRIWFDDNAYHLTSISVAIFKALRFWFAWSLHEKIK